MFTEKVGYPLGSTSQVRFEMDEEVFNIQLRKFLKKVGIQSQREIEDVLAELAEHVIPEFTEQNKKETTL